MCCFSEIALHLFSLHLMFQMFIPAVSHKSCLESSQHNILGTCNYCLLVLLLAFVLKSQLTQLRQPVHLLFSGWEDEIQPFGKWFLNHFPKCFRIQSSTDEVPKAKVNELKGNCRNRVEVLQILGLVFSETVPSQGWKKKSCYYIIWLSCYIKTRRRC